MASYGDRVCWGSGRDNSRPSSLAVEKDSHGAVWGAVCVEEVCLGLFVLSKIN